MIGPRTQESQHAQQGIVHYSLFLAVAAVLFVLGTVAAKGAAQTADDNLVDCAGQPYAITVVVTGVRSTKGVITADLHGDRPENFLKKGKKLARVRVPAQTGETRLCFLAPHAGVFAAGVYHDENGNRRFDKNFLGLPSEPYGVSNNPGFAFGPPKFEAAAFTVDDDGTEIRIKLRH